MTAARRPARKATLRAVAASLEAAERWELRLYVAGQTPKSLAAFANLKRICEAHLRGKYRIEVIDLLAQSRDGASGRDRRLAHPDPEASAPREADHRRPVEQGTYPGRHGARSGALRWREEEAWSEDGHARMAAGAVPPPERYVLKLYVTGATARSLRAIANIKAVCEQHLKGRYDLEVVDIYRRPERLRTDHIVAVPTLIKMLPVPLRLLVGDLSRTEQVLQGLDLVPRTP